MRVSNWYNLHVCRECETLLTNKDLDYSNGTCPHCGHTSNFTICDYKKITLRTTKHYKWWYIFGRKKTHEGKDRFSIEWLRKNLKAVR